MSRFPLLSFGGASAPPCRIWVFTVRPSALKNPRSMESLSAALPSTGSMPTVIVDFSRPDGDFVSASAPQAVTINAIAATAAGRLIDIPRMGGDFMTLLYGGPTSGVGGCISQAEDLA